MIWHAITVSPQRERLVASELKTSLGLKTCVPCVQKHRRSRGKNNRPVLIPYLLPLMPSYVFVGSRYSLPVYDIKSQQHVRDFVQFGGQYATLTDAEVVRIKMLAKQATVDLPSGYQVGDVVQITDGPFRSFEALIQEIRGGDIRVDVELFGRNTPHWRRVDQIEKVEAA